LIFAPVIFQAAENIRRVFVRSFSAASQPVSPPCHTAT
jgi:hypothetical protein